MSFHFCFVCTICYPDNIILEDNVYI
jgi:hypothetical protein